jgi:hypothetical protein
MFCPALGDPNWKEDASAASRAEAAGQERGSLPEAMERFLVELTEQSNKS